MKKPLSTHIITLLLMLTVLTGHVALAAPAALTATQTVEAKETRIPIRVETKAGSSYQAKILPMQEEGVSLDLNTVMLGGKVTESKSSGNGRKQVTIIWDKIIIKDKTIPLDASFRTVADTKKGNVPSGTELKAKGDIMALKEALSKLSNTATPSVATSFPPPGSTIVAQRNTGSTGNTPAATASSLPMGSTSGGTTQQSQAALPAATPTFTAPAQTTGGTPVINVSSDGCDITIDRAQNAAFVQVKITTNGEETMGCQPDPDQKYPITQDFTACQPKIEGDSYISMFTLGYLNPKTGQRVIIPGGDCQSDHLTPATAIMDITDGCTPTIDVDNRRVIVQVRSVYNLDGEQKDYKPCHESAKTYSINEATDSCAVSSYPAKKLAIQQTRLSYTDDTGRSTMVRDCTDSTNPAYSYPITQDFAACQPKMDGTTYTPLFTLGYFSPTLNQRVIVPGGECQADLTVPAAVITDITDGCTPRADFTNKQVITQVRSVYSIDGQQKEYQPCHDSSKAYVMSETIDNCLVSTYVDRKLAVQQTKLTASDDSGKVTVVRDCADSDNPAYSYAITQDFLACPPKMDGYNYTPMFTLGYFNPALNQRILLSGGECKSDASVPSAVITDITDGCTPRQDNTNKQLIIQVRSVYTIDGQQREYKSCHDSSRSYAMSETIDNCPVSHYVDRNLAIQQTKLTYSTDSGETIIARDCMDSANPAYNYTMTQDFAACAPKIDGTRYTAMFTLGYFSPSLNKRVTLSGGECMSDASVPSAAIMDITDGCGIRQDFANKQLIVQVRSVYTIDGQQKEYEPCHDSSKSYVLSEVTDNCPVSGYAVRKQAVQQTKLTYTDDTGTITMARDCADSDNPAYSYTLTQDFSTCPGTSDGSSYTPMFTIGYLNPTTHQRTLITGGECQSDPAIAPIAISDITDGCTPRLDFINKQVFPQVRSVYTINGEQKEYKSCHDAGKFYVMGETIDSCTINNQLANRVSIQQTKLAYTDDSGKTTIVQDCTDSSNPVYSYTITPDSSACTPKIEGNKLYQQFDYGYIDPVANKRVIVPDGACQTDVTVPAVDIVEVTDGCGTRYDFTNKIATVQMRSIYTLGSTVTEYKPCHDSAKTYAMSEGAGSCPVSHYLDKQLSIQQTKMTYQDDSGQSITAQDCTDSTTPSYNYPEKTTTSGCSVRADFTQMVAIPQSKIIYTANGTEHIIQDCADDDTLPPYMITSTREGCSAVQTATIITPFARKYITVNAMPVYLTSCAAEDSLNIVAEECTGTERLSNDFDTGQSYRNYSHYYVDGSTVMTLDHCVPGITPYPHQPDVAACSLQNDDTTHSTQYYAKTFITLEGQNIIIKDCSAVGNPIPYTLKNRVLTVLSQQTNKELSTDSDSTIYFSTPISSFYPNRPVSFPEKWNGYSNSIPVTDPYGNDYFFFGMNYTGFSLIFSGKNYCMNNELSLPTWITTDNQPIDKERSDEIPTFALTTFNSCNTTPCVKDHMEYSYRANNTWQGGINSSYGSLSTTGRTNTITYSCTKPTCAHFTKLGKVAVYSRGDGTEFTDSNDISDMVNVCGTGSKLQ